ncbi:hypothetical protein E2C01_101860 [Portunus trituberculatus]|uniref:Secreted protein n=1 Tax=Portunus trituberculatus TaxID=210409 RepID=A0A5B7KH30_PORTR|nr:hypothetical protein [Portunus trituberculatus]
MFLSFFLFLGRSTLLARTIIQISFMSPPPSFPSYPLPSSYPSPHSSGFGSDKALSGLGLMGSAGARTGLCGLSWV